MRQTREFKAQSPPDAILFHARHRQKLTWGRRENAKGHPGNKETHRPLH